MSQVTDVSLSFEVFPAQAEAKQRLLSQCVQQLSAYRPDYVSVTQGALGSDAHRSANSVRRLQQDTPATIASHITAGFADTVTIQAYAQSLHQQGVQRLVALRGDKRQAQGEGFADACALIKGLKQVADFDISVAAYPEVHPKAASAEADLQVLKAKFDAGASRAITQFFFDADQFLRFRDQARAAGIEQPIVAGILPITDFERTKRLAKQCGARIPESYHAYFEGTEGAYSGVQQVLGTDLARELCQRLLQEGVEGLHFYTLNQSAPTVQVLQALGLSAATDAAQGAAGCESLRELALAS